MSDRESGECIRVLMYGHRGWIGGKIVDLVERLHPSWKLILGVSRVDSKDLQDELDSVKPEAIICCIGRTHGENIPTIDYLEQPGKLRENLRDNLFGPVSLGLQAREIPVLIISTGCIYSYDSEHQIGGIGFSESDPPNFFGSSYSTVRGFTDSLLKLLPNVINLRIRMPISSDDHPRNFISKITRYRKICSISNSMTVLEDLLPIALDMLKNRRFGTWNFVNPGAISHDEILSMYRDIVDPSFTWENFSLEEQRQILRADRSNNTLDTERLEVCYPDVPPIRDAVKKTLQDMKKRRDLNRVGI